MDSELKREIEEMHALVKDNHRMLRAIRRSQWLSFMSTVIIWIVVLALPIYLYQQFLAPIVANFSSVSGMSTTTTSRFLGLPTSAELQKLIDQYKTK
ncbi:MAG: hypothetical protein WC887_02085 [Candidatus Paceibacterota bacterium]|jgi:Trk-type K+ transport system membrane component